MTAPADPPPSALVWISRSVAGPDDDVPFRATRADDTVTLRPVDADHLGASIVITPREVRGQVVVERAAITAVACAVGHPGRWELIAVAGPRIVLGHGTPASIAALARALAHELGVPHVDHGVALVPAIPPRWSATRPVAQLIVAHTPRTSSLILAVPLAALILGLVLDAALGLGDIAAFGAMGFTALAMWRLDAARGLRRHRQQLVILGPAGLQRRASGDHATFPLATVERFVPRRDSAALTTLAAICDGREVELITTHDPGGRDTRAIATRLNVELDQLRATGSR